MAKILIDVNGWHNLFDFKTGENLDERLDEPCFSFARELAQNSLYPGDTDEASLKWVTDCGINVCEKYSPDFMFLSYAGTNLIKVNTELTDEEYHSVNKLAVSEALRFAKTTGFVPIIVSTGNMKKFEKVLDLDDVDGYVGMCSHDPYMAGLFGASEDDISRLEEKDGVTYERREEFCSHFPKMDAYTYDQLPDVVMFADEHYAFTRTGYRGITKQVVATKEDFCFAYSTYNDIPDNIFDFRAYIDRKLDAGERVALIIVECVEGVDMPEGTKKVSREKRGVRYSEGGGFYYALCSSKEFWESNMAYIFHNPHHSTRSEKLYPFSYVKNENYQNPIGLRSDKKTAAVGTRSGITHSCLMCDYTVECHSRGLAESGVLVFINDKLDKSI